MPIEISALHVIIRRGYLKRIRHSSYFDRDLTAERKNVIQTPKM